MKTHLIIVCTLLLLTACQQAGSPADTLRVGLSQEVMTLDPRFATDAASQRIQEFLHRGLVRMDARFLPEPDLADWQRPEPLLWLFTLKEGARFHDGNPVTAQDVVATLQSILNPDTRSPHRSGFEAIEKVAAISDREVSIRLKHPDASLLTRLSMGILPEKLAALPQQARNIVGCGQFRLMKWDASGLWLQRITAEASKANKLVFLTVKDSVTRSLKMARGEIDFTQNDLPPHLLPYLKKQEALSIQSRPSTIFSYIGLNLQDERLKQNDVRRALALAIDRNRLKKALFSNLPVLAETILTPGHWAYTDLPATPFDAAEAESLLDKAGYPRNEAGIRFTLNYRTSTDPARLGMATAIADMWQKIGVNVSIESLEWGGFYARIKRGDFQVFSLSWVGIVDPDIYRLALHSSMWPPKGANRGRYADAEMDHWLDAAGEASDQAARKALYAKIEQKMQADQVYIPLWYEPVIAVSGPRVSGYRPSATGSLLGLEGVTLN